ncbi:alpha-L-arabinofuranosidase C-terminal domain-containing protein [Actinoallomurus vinaceus]|uniref:non-reducing end alpha-L-arabinofuranosidase n=1 Tax=Actinoallomurus vinaceus TaxID=1080074 RepID=A0ABP8UGD0_9ACTN
MFTSKPNGRRWPAGRARTRAALVVTACSALLAGVLTTTGVAAADGPALAGHWTLDEGSGTTAADSSGNDHTGTLGSGATWAAGQIGPHAVQFNGTGNGAVDIPEPVVDTSQSFTVSAWVKLDSTSGYQTAVSVDGGQISGFYLQLSGASGGFSFTRRTADDSNSTEVRADSGVAPAAGTWYHLVGVDDAASGKLKIYVDGDEGTDAGFTSAWKATGHTLIGRGKYGGNPVDFVHGAVDDVRFYQGALTAGQVEALEEAGHWTYDEGSGTTAADSSGNDHTGTLGSGATWTAGRVGAHAVALNGTANGEVTSQGPTLDTGGSFSVSAWAKLDQTTGDQDLASVNGSQVSAYELQLHGGKFAFARPASDSSSAAVAYATASTAPKAGQWYHLVGVDDVAAGKLQLYVNGLPAGSAAYTSAWKATGDTVIGGGRAANFLHGAVDDVRMYGYAMNLHQVQDLAGNIGGTLSVDAGTSLHSLPSTFFGLMTEDINHSMTGGLYPELINNRSMMADASKPVEWSAVGDAAISLDPGNPLNTALTRSLKVDISSTARAGVANGGYWGVPVTPRKTYKVSFFAKASAGFSGPLTVGVESADGAKVYASADVHGVGGDWKRFTATLRTRADAPTTADARFVVSTSGNAGRTLWLDNVSLFPPTYKNVKNGLRPDLMKLFAGLKPAFIREPGGNYLEGNTIGTRFDWKKTIGPVWTRPGHPDDAWGYWSTDGMGLLEYLEWCEQLGAEPMLAVYAGYSLNGSHVAQDQLPPYVQDALDEIEYATGPVTSTWGKKRAQDGHPAPFRIRYVEVGNEDWFDRSGSYNGYRFPMFYDAIKKAYPSMQVIATTGVTSRTPDILDDHYYQSPGWMNTHANLYDGHSRSGPKILVGEWASQEGAPTPDLNAAIGDASWLTGLERNSDLVIQEAYAPMLVNVHDDRWKTNLIGFDALTSYGSPSYYAQRMLANKHGDQVIGATYTGVGGINVVATKDSRSGRIYLTVVNPSSASQPVAVDLGGVGHIGPKGTATVLSSAHPTDTNTISQPANVVPKTTTVTGLGSTFTHTVPAYSVTVLTLN